MKMPGHQWRFYFELHPGRDHLRKLAYTTGKIHLFRDIEAKILSSPFFVFGVKVIQSVS